MKRSAIALAILAAASGVPAVSFGSNADSQAFVQMIAKAAPRAEMSPCNGTGTPDGGPICRNYKITCVVSLPIADADTMNGIVQRKFVRAKFVWYMNQWIQADIAAELARSKSGWTITEISLDDFGMDGRDKC